jgi:hypothetical protein
MSGTFDIRKALREELEGLGGILKALLVQERRAQEKMGEAETEYTTVVKLRGFAQAEIARKRDVLKAEEEKANG